MKRLVILVSIILTICTILSNGQPAPCRDYESPGLCSTVNTYQVSPVLGSQEATELLLLQLGIENITLVGKIDPVCGQAGLNYACSQAYASCDSFGFFSSSFFFFIYWFKDFLKITKKNK